MKKYYYLFGLLDEQYALNEKVSDKEERKKSQVKKKGSQEKEKHLIYFTSEYQVIMIYTEVLVRAIAREKISDSLNFLKKEISPDDNFLCNECIFKNIRTAPLEIINALINKYNLLIEVKIMYKKPY